MKSDYEQTLDKNFDKALELCSNSYTYKDLINFLKKGNIPEKQFAALEIKELASEQDAKIFISNLINCDGKIREAIAQKFSEFVRKQLYRDYFSKFPKILAKGTIDINANISRMVIDGLSMMTNYNDFGYEYSKQLVSYIEEAFSELDKIVFRDKKYTINKQLFKLYWCLEGLNNYYIYLSEEELKRILEKALEQKEYTVREKIAQILIKQNKSKYKALLDIIQEDNNYYIKKILEK